MNDINYGTRYATSHCKSTAIMRSVFKVGVIVIKLGEINTFGLHHSRKLLKGQNKIDLGLNGATQCLKLLSGAWSNKDNLGLWVLLSYQASSQNHGG